MEREEAQRLAVAFGPAVYRLAYARMGNAADAEDVTQETFLRLLKAGPAFRDDGHAKAWLLKVAAQRAADAWRAPWRRHESQEDPPDSAGPGPEPEPGGVLERVLALPKPYRAVVHLFYYEGYSAAETAAILGKTEGAVKTRLSRARALLRRELVEEGGEESAGGI